MTDTAGEVLPYRVNPEELVRWINARARGRSGAQLRDSGLPAKTLEGLASAATALGWVDAEEGGLTPEGERFALATEEERRGLLRDAMLAFAPYRRLLAAVAARPGRAVTDTEWIETWWATHGYGSSPSNRMEGAAAFGRLAEWAGWGRYVPGRRGHPTRVEWNPAAMRDVEKRSDAATASRPVFAPAPEPVTAPAPAPAPAPARADTRASGGDYNRVTLPLERGRVARLEVPQRLSSADKRRLLALLDLLIREEEEPE